MVPYTMAMMAAQQQDMMNPMAMGSPMMGDTKMQEAMQRKVERLEQYAAMRAALDLMSVMQGSGMGGMGGDPREAMMVTMQDGGHGGPGMPVIPGGSDPYGMMQPQGGMGGGMSGHMMNPRMAGSMAGGVGGMMDPRMGGGMAMVGGDPYGMTQGQGGMAGGIDGLIGPRMAGDDSGFDMAVGIIMDGGPRRGRCRRC